MRDVKELNEAQAVARQRREWTIQRGGWIAMTLLVLASALGLLGGGGPLATRTAGEEGEPIWVVYERLARLETPTTLRVHLTTGPADGSLSIWVTAGYLEHVEVRQIMPPPQSARVDADRVVYTFETAATDRPVVIALTVQPDDPGLLRAEIGRSDGPAVRLTQTVLP